MSLMDQWFLIGVCLFGVTTLIHLVGLWRPHGKVPEVSLRVLEISLIFWTLLLFCWSLRFAGIGLNRLVLGLSGWSVALLYRISLSRYALHSAGSVVCAVSTLLATFSFLFAKPLALNPELNRWLLMVHIGLAMIGVTAFIVSGIFSGLYLIQAKRLKAKRPMRSLKTGRLPSLFTLDELCVKSSLFGFPFYTLALLLGSVQAFQSQGSLHLSYVVAFISWFIFGGVIQARLTAGWRGQRAAWLTVIATACALSVLIFYSARN